MSVWGQRSVLVFWGCVLLAVVCCPVVVIVHLYILLGLGWRVLSLFYWHWVLGRLPMSKSVRLLSMVEVFVVLWYSFCRMSRWWCRLRMLLRGCRETCIIFDTADSPSKMPAHDTRHGFMSVSSMLFGFFAFATSRETAYDACTIDFDSVWNFPPWSILIFFKLFAFN